MAKGLIEERLIEETAATPVIHSYTKLLGRDRRQLSSGKTVLKSLFERYDVICTLPTEFAQLDRGEIERPFMDKQLVDAISERSARREQLANRLVQEHLRSRTGAMSPEPGALTSEQLWIIVRDGCSTIAGRSRSLVELMRRKDPAVASLVVEELEKDPMPAWRNTLIFATEHLDFTDLRDRDRLRSRLFSCAHAINTLEWHPRSQAAMAAAVRRYLSMLDSRVALGTVLPLLSANFPIRIRRIAIVGIEAAFRDCYPTAAELEALAELGMELRETARYLIRRPVLNRNEDEFGLGLDALDALIRIGDRETISLIRQAKAIGCQWICSQLCRTISSTITVWRAAVEHSPSLSVLSEADHELGRH